MFKICAWDDCLLPKRPKTISYCPEHYFRALHLACLQFRNTWHRPDLYLGRYG